MNNKWRQDESRYNSYDATGVLSKFQDAAIGQLRSELSSTSGNAGVGALTGMISSFFSKSTTPQGFYSSDELEPFAFDEIELCQRGDKDPATHTYVVEDTVKL